MNRDMLIGGAAAGLFVLVFIIVMVATGSAWTY